MLRIVGDVADSVSSLRLVDFLPKVEGSSEVLSDNFGRLLGAGTGASRVVIACWLYVAGDEGSMASDIVLVAPEVGDWMSGSGCDCGIKASMIPTAWY